MSTITPLVGALIGNWAIRVPVAVFMGGVLELDVVWIVPLLDRPLASRGCGQQE